MWLYMPMGGGGERRSLLWPKASDNSLARRAEEVRFVLRRADSTGQCTEARRIPSRGVGVGREGAEGSVRTERPLSYPFHLPLQTTSNHQLTAMDTPRSMTPVIQTLAHGSSAPSSSLSAPCSQARQQVLLTLSLLLELVVSYLCHGYLLSPVPFTPPPLQ